MNKIIRNVNFLLVGCLIFVGFVACNKAFASGDRIEQEVEVKNVLTGGDNTAQNNALISGSRSYSLPGHDVDINDCLYSWGAVIQGVKLNRWCAAERMDSMGLHDGAAMMRCTIRPILKLYVSEFACITGQTVKAVEVPQVEPEITHEDDDEHDKEIEALYARLSAIEAQSDNNARKAAQRTPQIVERTVVEQRPLLTQEMAESLRVKK